MTSFSKFARRRALVAAIALLIPASHAAANSSDERHAWRIHAIGVASDADFTGAGDSADTAVGLYIGYEYRWNQRFGLELGLAEYELEQSDSFSEFFVFSTIEAALRVTPITLALNIHLLADSRHDLYIAPKVGWVMFDDFEVTTSTDFGFPVLLPPDFFRRSFLQPIEDRETYGLKIGFDTALGDGPISFSASLDYSVLEARADDLPIGRSGEGIDLDPLVLGAGIAFRF